MTKTIDLVQSIARGAETESRDDDDTFGRRHRERYPGHTAGEGLHRGVFCPGGRTAGAHSRRRAGHHHPDAGGGSPEPSLRHPQQTRNRPAALTRPHFDLLAC